MAHLKFHQDILGSFFIRLKEKGSNFPQVNLSSIIDLIEDKILDRYVDRLLNQEVVQEDDLRKMLSKPGPEASIATA